MLYDHQKKIINEDAAQAGVFLGTGGGKTRIALSLAEGVTFVIAPKTQVEDKNWERELRAMREEKIPYRLTELRIISKETFRRDWQVLSRCDTLIFEEVHTILGVSPTMGWLKRERVVKTSQLFAAARGYAERHKPARLYLVTATPVRNPLCVWAAATLLGRKWDFRKFRDTFYIQLPMPGREVWRPRTDGASKERLAKAVQKLGYTGALSDWFDVPEQTDKVVYVHPTADQTRRLKTLRLDYPDPLVYLGKRHQVENGVLAGDEYKAPEMFLNEKIEHIIGFAYEFPKVVVFAKYLNQITEIAEALKHNGKKVFILTGATVDRGAVIKAANEAEECVFIAQSQISAGYELPGFPCVVYASMSWSVVDLEQSRGRVLRANHLKKNLYVYLVMKDGVDEAVYKTLMTKRDFNDAIFIKENPKFV